MGKQTDLVHGTNWDVLIVLDGCRYDYFKELHRRYLNGALSPVMSADFQTQNWVEKVWLNRDEDYLSDVTYVSANPHINSLGVGAFGVEPLNLHEVFKEVVDVWKTGWSEELNVTLPGPVTDEGLKRLKRNNSPLVLHYLQPHEPYIPLLRGSEGDEGGREKTSLIAKTGFGVDTVALAKTVFDTIPLGDKLKDVTMNPERTFPRIHIMKILNLEPRFPGDVARVYSYKVLREAYRENLETVLEEVQRLVSSPLCSDLDIYLTSDHGEALGGEEGFGHKQMQVPWMEVETDA